MENKIAEPVSSLATGHDLDAAILADVAQRLRYACQDGRRRDHCVAVALLIIEARRTGSGLALLWIGAWFIGILATHWRDEFNTQHELTFLHEAMASTLLFLIVVRIAWRITHPAPIAGGVTMAWRKLPRPQRPTDCLMRP